MNYLVREIGEHEEVVTVDGDRVLYVDKGHGREAAAMLLRVHVLNDVKRQYTNAARVVAQINALPGIVWAADESSVLHYRCWCGRNRHGIEARDGDTFACCEQIAQDRAGASS